MDSYLLLKLIHIISAVVVVGTGVGIAFFMLMAFRSKNLPAIYITAKHVILGDWIFTTPAILTLLVSGILLMNKLGYSISSPWFHWVMGLFILMGVCWIPVLFIQYRLRDLSHTLLSSEELTGNFANLMKIWISLGIVAFAAVGTIFWLMVFKPFSVV